MFQAKYVVSSEGGQNVTGMFMFSHVDFRLCCPFMFFNVCIVLLFCIVLWLNLFPALHLSTTTLNLWTSIDDVNKRSPWSRSSRENTGQRLSRKANTTKLRQNYGGSATLVHCSEFIKTNHKRRRVSSEVPIVSALCSLYVLRNLREEHGWSYEDKGDTYDRILKHRLSRGINALHQSKNSDFNLSSESLF